MIIGIIIFCFGLIIGVLITIYANIGFFDDIINKLKIKYEQNIMEKNMKKELDRQAKIEAIKKLQGERIKHFYNKEKDKLIGKDKEKRKEKLKQVFSNNMNMTNSINEMIGNGLNSNSNRTNSRKNNKKVEIYHKEKSSKNEQYFGNIDFGKKVDDMLGFKKK